MLKVALLFAAGLFNLVFAFAVIQRDFRKLNNISFFILTSSIAGWALGIAFFLLSNSPNAALNWAKVYYFFPLVIAVGLVLFVMSFPNRTKVTRQIFIPLLLGFVLLAVPLIFIRPFVTEYVEYHSWGKEIVLNRAHYLFYATYLLICYPASLFVMYKKSKSENGLYKKQAEVFFKGFTFTAIFAVTFNLILPWIGNYRLIWLGPLFVNSFLAAIAYSIIKHRMFNLRLIFARSLAYLLSLGILVVGYSAVSQVVASRFFSQGNRLANFDPANILLIVFTALSYGYVKRFFDKITNSIFYRDAYDTQLFLGELNKLLVSTMDLTYLLDQTSSIINRNMKPSFTVIGLRETDTRDRQIVGADLVTFKEKDIDKVRLITPEMNQKVIVTDRLNDDYRDLHETLSRNDVAVIIRLVDDVTSHKEGIGYLALGSKKSGNPYNKQDIQALEIIANELVIAIQNALRFEEIEKFNVTLQQKIDSATSKLERNNEKLKALDETKDEFISMASHQLRTPLTSVKGYLSMVLEGDAGKITAPQRKMLDQAFVSSQRMVFLIADLLNVSRLRTGKFILEPVRANLADIVEGEVDQLKETAKGRNLKLKFVKPKGISDLMLDETKIRQVVMNFMDNAIYYTPGGGDIKIELTETPKTIQYTVTDGGIGVPKAEQHNLFTKFYRANNAQKTRPDGTGLGLFMAKKVIIAHGGGIVFKSQVDKGSTFGFVLDKTRLKPQFEPTDPK